MGNLFSKKKPVVDEPTQTTPGENAEEGATNTNEAATSGVNSESKNSDGVTSEGSAGDPNKVNQVDTTVEDISIAAESINLEASGPAVCANLEGGALISPESANQSTHGSAGHSEEAVIISPESVNRSTHESPDNQTGAINISQESENQNTHGSSEPKEGGSSNEAVSVEHSERFRTEQRTKVTTPIEALEFSLSESPSKSQQATIVSGQNNSEKANSESPIIEQFEHLTLESAPSTQSKPDTNSLHDETPQATTTEANHMPDNKTSKEGSSPLIEFGDQ